MERKRTFHFPFLVRIEQHNGSPCMQWQRETNISSDHASLFWHCPEQLASCKETWKLYLLLWWQSGLAMAPGVPSSFALARNTTNSGGCQSVHVYMTQEHNRLSRPYRKAAKLVQKRFSDNKHRLQFINSSNIHITDKPNECGKSQCSISFAVWTFNLYSNLNSLHFFAIKSSWGGCSTNQSSVI